MKVAAGPAAQPKVPHRADDTGSRGGGDPSTAWERQPIPPRLEAACAAAARAGDLPLLRRLHEEGCPWNETTCNAAVAAGHTECLMYAHEAGCQWSANTCTAAAEAGRLDALALLHEAGCPWDAYTCYCAARFGRLDCLRYARERGCPWEPVACWNAGSKHPAVAEWMRSLPDDPAAGGWVRPIPWTSTPAARTASPYGWMPSDGSARVRSRDSGPFVRPAGWRVPANGVGAAGAPNGDASAVTTDALPQRGRCGDAVDENGCVYADEDEDEDQDSDRCGDEDEFDEFDDDPYAYYADDNRYAEYGHERSYGSCTHRPRATEPLHPPVRRLDALHPAAALPSGGAGSTASQRGQRYDARGTLSAAMDVFWRHTMGGSGDAAGRAAVASGTASAGDRGDRLDADGPEAVARDERTDETDAAIASAIARLLAGARLALVTGMVVGILAERDAACGEKGHVGVVVFPADLEATFRTERMQQAALKHALYHGNQGSQLPMLEYHVHGRRIEVVAYSQPAYLQEALGAFRDAMGGWTRELPSESASGFARARSRWLLTFALDP